MDGPKKTVNGFALKMSRIVSVYVSMYKYMKSCRTQRNEFSVCVCIRVCMYTLYSASYCAQHFKTNSNGKNEKFASMNSQDRGNFDVWRKEIEKKRWGE